MTPALPGMTPHWGGAWVALGCTVLLMGWLLASRGLSRRRWIIATVMLPQLALLALIGNGTRGVHVVGFSGPRAPSALADSWLARAVATASSSEFLAYQTTLEPGALVPDGAKLRSRLSVHFMSVPDLERLGQHPPPNDPGARWVFYEYVDRQNAVFRLLGLGEDALEVPSEYVRRCVFEYLEELFWLEAVRGGADDAWRVEALRALMRHGVPMPAEWIVRELDRIRASWPGATPELSAAWAEARAWAQRSIDDPELRQLSPR